MKKKILLILLSLVIGLCVSVPAFAAQADGFASEYERVQDLADLLSDSEEAALLEKLDELCERQKMEIVVLTTDTLEGLAPRDYADDIYDYCDFGYGEDRDGALLLISMEDNDWYISTCGYGITVFTDAGIQYIGEQIKEDLSDGDFSEAFDKFVGLCDDFITQARSGDPYDSHNLPKEPLSLIWIPISIAVGVCLSFIIVGNMKSKLKTVRFQAAASNYMKNGSLNAINEDTTNCYASYRYGTSYYTVTAGNGKLTGPGVKYPNGNGKFLVGDTVNIKPNEKKSSDGTLIPFKEWTSEGVALASPTTPNTSFNVPTNDVTVTATYNPFDGAPVFTRTSDSSGTIKFKTVANPDNSEFFEYVKDGETAYNRPYSQPTTTSSASPYEYSLSVSTYYAGDIKNLEAGDYRMAVTLNGERYLSEKFTVNYTAPVTTYTVSFNANGGTGTMADVTDISGEYTLPANGFTAPAGKQFKAWSVGGVEKAAGDKITVTANTTVTAVWEDIPVVTYTVSGSATSFGSDTDNVIIQLIAEGFSEADYEVFVQGNSAAYSIEGVAPGTYTMKVMKQNHVTREYTVTVGSSNVVQDVKIHLFGDINGDGKVNMKDWGAVYAHVNETKLLTGYE